MPAPINTRRRLKELLRKIAIELCNGLLQSGSKPYVLAEEATVVIAPHQDDESLACGGLIARKRHEGLPVHVIFITDGSASHPGHARFPPPALAALRRGEALQALACLGVERSAIHFLDEPDGTLKAITAAHREALVRRLARQLQEIGAAELFLPCNPDGSSEHDATFGFVMDALALIPRQPVVWQYPVWSWWNPVLLLRRWFATKDCRALPLEDFRQHKLQAIRCYQSQVEPLAPDSAPSLPARLVEVFLADTEFYFRYQPPAPSP